MVYVLEISVMVPSRGGQERLGVRPGEGKRVLLRNSIHTRVGKDLVQLLGIEAECWQKEPGDPKRLGLQRAS